MKAQISFISALTLILILGYGKATGQDKEHMPPEERATKLTSWMKTNLQLTDDQVAKVGEINLKYANKNEALRNSPEPGREKLKKLKSFDQDKDNELKTLLTDEQYKTYQAKKEEIKEEFKAKAKEKRKG